VPRARDEPVRLTKIYTRGGDTGETSLGDGSRVSKLDGRIEAFGAVDELNAALGLVLAGDLPDELRGVIARVQNELFDLGADLSVPAGVDGRLRVEQSMVDRLERIATGSTPSSPSCAASCFPAGRRLRRVSTSLARSVGAPSGTCCAPRRSTSSGRSSPCT
jgi:cob(I)alamin adenosyltransferase